MAFVILLPVYWIFISSITPSNELFSSPIEYIPEHPTLGSALIPGLIMLYTSALLLFHDVDLREFSGRDSYIT